MHTALYRAHRPETFDQLLGQDHIVRILKNQLAAGTVSHAYLFCGTRGTGKTTTARILAKGVNCTAEGELPCGRCKNCEAIKDGLFMDVIEIDAASNNGVENIRELRESVKFPPATGKKKVYIIDEVHMLSTGAFNALLKTLEEPPEYVIFLLATTEPQKLPATILSRCMRLDFKRVAETVLVEGMQQICKQKKIEVSTGALRLIATNADGSVRDGLSILDQCISAGQTKVEREDILDFLGATGTEIFIQLTQMICLGKLSEALVLLNETMADGKDVRQFMRDWLGHYRNLLIVKFINNPEDMLNMSSENVERVKEQSDSLELSEINRGIRELSQTMAEAKWSTQPGILLELCIVKLATDMLNPQGVLPGSNPANKMSVDSASKPKTKETAATNKTPQSVDQSGFGSSDGASSDTTQPHADSEAKASDPPKSESNPPAEFDCETLWHTIFEEGETRQGSFNLIRSGTTLEQIEEREFHITASSRGVAQYVESNREVLEDLMEKHTGERRTLVCCTKDKDAERNKQADINSLAKAAQEALGVDIEIQ